MIPKTHPLDHLVLPTADLGSARARLAALGFTVAPRGVHPFGTENCCVYLADGTFLEPLAVADAGVVAKAVAAGNVFVGRDRAYRHRFGSEGFSAVVFGTEDAGADDRAYRDAGVSAGDMLSFSRPFVDSAGRSDTASFKLAFAAYDGPDDAFVFACERVNAPKVDRAALQAHPNGATAIAEVVAVSDDPAAQLRFLATAARAGAVTGSTVRLPNAVLNVLNSSAFEDRFGVPGGRVTGLRFAAVVFAVQNLERVERQLVAHHVQSGRRAGELAVPLAPGQGAIFAFREAAR